MKLRVHVLAALVLAACGGNQARTRSSQDLIQQGLAIARELARCTAERAFDAKRADDERAAVLYEAFDRGARAFQRNRARADAEAQLSFLTNLDRLIAASQLLRRAVEFPTTGAAAAALTELRCFADRYGADDMAPVYIGWVRANLRAISNGLDAAKARQVGEVMQ